MCASVCRQGDPTYLIRNPGPGGLPPAAVTPWGGTPDTRQTPPAPTVSTWCTEDKHHMLPLTGKSLSRMQMNLQNNRLTHMGTGGGSGGWG